MNLSPFVVSLLVFLQIALLSQNVLGHINDRQLRKPVNCELLKDGNYVWDCSSYYSICANGRELPMECYSGLKLNPNSNQCDAPSAVDPCLRKHRTANVLYRAADPFNCQEHPDGDYEANACSNRYYTCVKGQKHDKHCPPGLMFNINTRVCDFASKCHKKPYNDGIKSKNGGEQNDYERAPKAIGMRAENEELDENGTTDQQKEDSADQQNKAADNQTEKGGKTNAKNEKPKKSGTKNDQTAKDNNKMARKRRAISSYIPPHQFLSDQPPAAAAEQQQAPTEAHYTIFNLYFPKNPKFNVVRSDNALDTSSADEIDAIADLWEQAKARANRATEKSDDKQSFASVAKKDMEVEEIDDLLNDTEKNL